MPESYRLFIQGKWEDARGGASYPVHNPATEELVAHAADAAPEDMERAIESARRAFDEGPWRKTTPSDRARVLFRLADLMEQQKDALRDLLVRAFGAEAMTLSIQLDAPIQYLRCYAELATKLNFVEPLPLGTQRTQAGQRVVSSIAVRQPAGVCGLIPTWNYPLYVTVQKIGPALAAGCTMVVKPSPFGPLADVLLAGLVEQCDVPPGVYNVVTGQSPALGATLAESPAVDKVSFTGSSATGKAIARAAATTLKRLHLELGGKSAAIVLEDADLDLAVPGLAAPAYFHAGQGCALCTRVLVPRKLHDAVVERMAAFVKGFVRVGDPKDPRVTLGPLIRDERRRAVEALIASGVEQGAKLVTGGSRPSELPKGWFLEPTIFAGADNTMRIAQEEIFGPVVCVIPYDTEEQAIQMANQSRYGLSGAILTRNVAKALEMSKRLRTGGVSINQANHAEVTPFGGFKESGLGREGGAFGVLEYTELQRISWPA
jgi:aldehyde dehydrogenase (NAD+)